MRSSLFLSLLAAAAAVAMLTGSVLAEEGVTGSEIPTNAYHDDPLTADEREGIASEENVSPDDGESSMPAPADRGVIPTPAPVVPGDGATAPEKPDSTKTAESEADIILDDAKKSRPVTRGEYERCLQQWDAQTQMTKKEWAESCRTTLQYYPEGSN
jgi:hypothetical protein